jgi:hypothetical protein
MIVSCSRFLEAYLVICFAQEKDPIPSALGFYANNGGLRGIDRSACNARNQNSTDAHRVANLCEPNDVPLLCPAAIACSDAPKDAADRDLGSGQLKLS